MAGTAEKTGEKTGGKLGKYVDFADHPLLFAFAITLMVVPMMALLTVGFAKMGWPGPQALVQTP